MTWVLLHINSSDMYLPSITSLSSKLPSVKWVISPRVEFRGTLLKSPVFLHSEPYFRWMHSIPPSHTPLPQPPSHTHTHTHTHCLSQSYIFFFFFCCRARDAEIGALASSSSSSPLIRLLAPLISRRGSLSLHTARLAVAALCQKISVISSEHGDSSARGMGEGNHNHFYHCF